MKITFESTAAASRRLGVAAPDPNQANEAPESGLGPDNDYSLTEVSRRRLGNPEVSDDKRVTDEILQSEDFEESQGEKSKSGINLAKIIEKMMNSEGRGGIFMAYLINLVKNSS